MKKLLLSAFAVLSTFAAQAQIKYVDEIYTDASITVRKNDSFARHLSIITLPVTGKPLNQLLTMDVYSSSSNTDAAKPLVIFLHTGNFLPIFRNKGVVGSKTDSATVEICKRFAKRGYVVAAISYRQGWNPNATGPGGENIRRETIINAAYRGVQDLAACVRYFKKSVKSGGNIYSIDTNKIVVGGQGTGGYVTLAYATLDRQDEIRIKKFYNSDSMRYMVQDSLLLGDRLGFKIPGTNPTLCIENHKGHSSNVQMAFNIGGALGDSSWLEKGSLPIASVHSILDPFAPYDLGIVSVPGQNLNVVPVSGSYDVMKRTNKYGNNASYKGKVFDWYTMRANSINDGLEGLFPIAGAANFSGPYEWWDTTAVKTVMTAQGYTTAEIREALDNADKANPLHKFQGKARAMKYIDTIVGYFAPRMAVTLGLVASVGIKDNNLSSNVTVAPNPAKDQLLIHNNWTNRSLVSAELVDLNGRSIQKMNLSPVHNVVNLNASSGIYMLRLQFNDGVGVQKLIIE